MCECDKMFLRILLYHKAKLNDFDTKLTEE